MDLTNEFKVGVPIEQAWAILTDVERIAPCMPGAQLQEVEGDEYRGVVKVKVGPITAQYKGAARFVEKDDTAKRVVLRAEGRDTRGQGNAAATITAELHPAEDGSGGTHVSVVTDLTVTGKVAQFGRGVLADVSAKLLDQFVGCLESDVLTAGAAAAADAAGGAGGTPQAMPAPEASQAPAAVAPAPVAGTPASPSSATATATATSAESAPGPVSGNGAGGQPTVRRIDSKPVQPVDLLGTAGAPVARRLAPAFAVVVLLLLLRRRRRRRRS